MKKLFAFLGMAFALFLASCADGDGSSTGGSSSKAAGVEAVIYTVESSTYVAAGGTVSNTSGSTVGSVASDGTVTISDSSSTIVIKSDGTATKDNSTVTVTTAKVGKKYKAKLTDEGGTVWQIVTITSSTTFSAQGYTDEACTVETDEWTADGTYTVSSTTKLTLTLDEMGDLVGTTDDGWQTIKAEEGKYVWTKIE